jgi:cold shock CspA family protein
MTGTILWWDTRDGNGIIRDAEGNEYYTDNSVTNGVTDFKSGQTVSFEPDTSIKHCPCGRNVRLV